MDSFENKQRKNVKLKNLKKQVEGANLQNYLMMYLKV